MTVWEYEHDRKVVKVEPAGPLIVRLGATVELAVGAALAESGIIQLFEDWLRPHFDSGALEPVLEPCWQRFSGPLLYYPGPRHPSRPASRLRRLRQVEARLDLTAERFASAPE